MATQFVKPAPGRQVRHPDRGFQVIPEEGSEVELTPYMKKRLIEGDLVPAKKVKAKPEAKEAGKDTKTQSG